MGPKVVPVLLSMRDRQASVERARGESVLLVTEMTCVGVNGRSRR